MRRLIALIAGLLALALATGAAFAHAGLVTTDPADGARLDHMPAALALTFSETVAPMRITLTGPDGATTPLITTADGPTVRAALPAAAGDGSYLLSWRITSADGHPVSGALAFTIGAATPLAPSPAAGGPTPLGGAIWLVRLLHYAALFLGVGSIGMAEIMRTTSGRHMPRALTVLGLLLVPLALLLQGLDLTGGSLPADMGAAVSAAVGSSYGRTQLAFAAAFALALVPRRGAALLALAVAALAPTLSGHASTAAPQWAMRAAVALHMLALLGWIGALWPLLCALRTDGREALSRFSLLIPSLIALLVASGLGMALVQMGWPNGAWLSPYAILLGGKLALVALLLGLGFWNRILLAPRARAGAAAPLRRTIGIELVVALVVLAIVAGWRFTAPPRVLAAIADATAPAIAELTGDGTATLSLTPGHAGPMTGRMTLSLGAPAQQVTLLLASKARDIAPLTRIATPEDATHWRVDNLALPLGGDWQATIRARLDRFTLATLSGTISLSDSKDTTMNRTLLAATTAAVLATAPALAEDGISRDGCHVGQTFATGGLTVSGAFTRATPPSAQSAGGYLTIANSGTEDDTLLGASTPAARTTGVHEMKMKGDVMEMAELEKGLGIPAGGTVALAPRGYHLMMVGLVQPFHEGECVALTLHFAKAGDIAVQLNVGGLAQQTPPAADGAHDMGGMSHEMSHDMSGMSMN